MEPLFTWLHLSDIHFEKELTPGMPRILEQLRRAIQQRATYDIPDPDAILVTGDVANTGGAKGNEYTVAKKWLMEVAGELGLSKDRIFLVPGNHDVRRANAGTSEHLLIEAVRNGTEPLDGKLREKKPRGHLRSRLKPFLGFAKGFAPVDSWKDGDGLAWKWRLESKKGLPVRLVGLNTALLANDAHDFQKLRVGDLQLDFALTPTAQDEAVIILSHHPFEWLADGESVRQWIASLAHVHLSGHVHVQHFQSVVTGGGSELIHVAAGASFEASGAHDHLSRFSFNFGALVGEGTEAQALRLWPLAWSDKNKDFRLDADNVPPGRHFKDYRLRQTVARKVLRSNPPALPPAPQRVDTIPPPLKLNYGTYSPVLSVYVVWHPQFLQGEALARKLYGLLCRGDTHPITRGIGIPVWFRSAPVSNAGPEPLPISIDAAQRTAVIVLIDDYLMADKDLGWGRYVDSLMASAATDPRMVVIPVAFNASGLKFNQRHGIEYLPVMEDPPSTQWKKIAQRVTHQLSWLLLAPLGQRPTTPPKVTALLSHATHDGADVASMLEKLAPADEFVRVTFDKVEGGTGSNFRKTIPHSLETRARGEGAVVLVVMQTDLHSSREQCQLEVVTAKKLGVPILLVHRLEGGEARSFPYLGNVPSLTWTRAGSDDAERAQALRDRILGLVLRREYLHLHLKELCRLYGVEEGAIQLTSPPELFTLGVQQRQHPSRVVVYPDPPLGEVEREILLEQDPELTLLTPTLLPGWSARQVPGKKGTK